MYHVFLHTTHDNTCGCYLKIRMEMRDQLISEIEDLRKDISSRLELVDAGKLRQPNELSRTENMIDDFTEK